ncbi:kinase-like domain-containing protein [Syncephalis fuscata]|nr:kinase-like domain-containing protein [Syncephalis fuscata]
MEAKYIFKQLLEGIQHLHSMNIIYRDIKPDNMLLFGGQGGPRVVFTDFGMACILPPALLNAKEHRKPADMWGLGATLHTMLLGKCKQKQKQTLTV